MKERDEKNIKIGKQWVYEGLPTRDKVLTIDRSSSELRQVNTLDQQSSSTGMVGINVHAHRIAVMPMKPGHQTVLGPFKANNGGDMRIPADPGPESDFDIRLTPQTAIDSDIARLSIRDLMNAQQRYESSCD